MTSASAEHEGKVAILLPSFHGGGAERVALNLAGYFATKGLPVDLVVVHNEGPYRSLVPGGVRVVDLGAGRVLAGLPALVRYLQRERPISLLSLLEHTNLVALWARRLSLTPVRVVVGVHNVLSQNLARSPSRRDRILPLLARLFYRSASMIVAASEGAADDLAKVTGIHRSRIHVTYDPVVTPELAAKGKQEVEDAWFQPGGPPVILGAGRLTAQKDFATLLRAFVRVRAERPTRLIILGEGELRRSLETLATELGLSGDVQLPGFVTNPYAYMSRAAVFVLSSAWEGFGVVLVEAMACGLPVVSTDCRAGPSEILAGGKYGRLVPVGDAPGLAQAICATLDNPTDPALLRARANEFSLERIGEQYLDLLCPQ